jgi:hypothetical protein
MRRIGRVNEREFESAIGDEGIVRREFEVVLSSPYWYG